MRIGIIGTGNMGSGLGKQWAATGHQVLFGSRDPQKARTLASAVGENASSGTYAEAARFGEAVLLAVPWRGVQDAIASAGAFAEKILIDCTNPMTADYMSLMDGHPSSGAEEIARWAAGAQVVKAFNHTYAQIIHSSPQFGGHTPTAFYCGDDPAAKTIVASLISDIGFEPVDAGPLQNARYLEPLAEHMVHLAYALGMGTDQALKLIRR
jgi:NADPH-dependent F420 reductase